MFVKIKIFGISVLSMVCFSLQFLLCQRSNSFFYCRFKFAIISDLVITTKMVNASMSSLPCCCRNWYVSVLNALTLARALTCSSFSPTLACRTRGLARPARYSSACETWEWVRNFTLCEKRLEGFLLALALLICLFYRLVQHCPHGFSSWPRVRLLTPRQAYYSCFQGLHLHIYINSRSSECITLLFGSAFQVENRSKACLKHKDIHIQHTESNIFKCIFPSFTD